MQGPIGERGLGVEMDVEIGVEVGAVGGEGATKEMVIERDNGTK